MNQLLMVNASWGSAGTSSDMVGVTARRAPLAAAACFVALLDFAVMFFSSVRCLLCGCNGVLLLESTRCNSAVARLQCPEAFVWAEMATKMTFSQKQIIGPSESSNVRAKFAH